MGANPRSEPPVRRSWRVAAALLGVVAGGYGALLLAGNSPWGRGFLRDRSAAALARRLPSARLSGDPGIDWRLRIGLGSLEIPAGEPGGEPPLRVDRVAVTPRWIALLAGRAEAETIRLRGVRLRLPGVGELPPFDVRVRPGPPVRLTADLVAGGELALEVVPRGPGEADLSLSLTGGSIDDPRLATVPVGPIAVTLAGRLRWDAAARSADLSQGRLALGPGVGADVDASWVSRPEPRASFSLRADRIGWEALVAALPEALRPVPAAPRLRGALSFHLRLDGPPARPAEWQLDAGLDLSALKAAGPVAVAGPFTWQAPESAGTERTIRVGPGNPSFVPLDEVPRVLVGAVTLSEDAGFFGHHGFDFSEIREALAEAAGSGRARGASTISQQVAKNLYLSGERTLARKVREALATVALEASLPKRRLREIYLNVAEWGPGLFGIGEASRHYFAKAPRDLTAREAAFLATIIPSPVRYHVFFERGALSETWEQRVRVLLAKMLPAEVITPAEYLAALEEPMTFARAEPRAAAVP